MKEGMNHISISRRAVLCAALAAGTSLASAQESTFPNRPIRFLVGYAAGGGVDTMARIVAQRLGTALGQSVIVENRGGAASMIAADVVAKAPADGYTLMYGESALLIAPLLRKTPLDPLKALVPIAGTFQSRLMIVASSKVPAANPRELVALLKANPGRYSYGTSGVGTVHHLGFELMKSKTDAFVIHIPYRGASQIVPDVISGELPIGVVSAAAAVPHVRAGKLKAIATMSTRMPGAEEVPPLSDALPGFNVGPRQMLLAPAGTPPEVAEAATKQGVSPAYMAPDLLAKDLQRESSDWMKVVNAQKISAE